MQASVRPESTEVANPNSAFCPLYHHAVELIGRRWTGAILRALLNGVCRFSGLTSVIPELSDRMLSERLKELEAEGIITRTVYAEIPVRVEYHLTPKGEALSDVMDSISRWASDWLAPASHDEHHPQAGPRSR